MVRKFYFDGDFFSCCGRLMFICTTVWTLWVRVAKLGFQIRVIIIGTRSLEVFLIRRFWDEIAQERKWVLEEDRCWLAVRQDDPQGKPWTSKAAGLTRAQLCQAVIHTRQKLDISERRTCTILDVARSSLRYQAKATDNTKLRLAMIQLAKQYGWYGYRKGTALLRVEGWRVNHSWKD